MAGRAERKAIKWHNAIRRLQRTMWTQSLKSRIDRFQRAHELRYCWETRSGTSRQG